jgi:hypothetical protein
MNIPVMLWLRNLVLAFDMHEYGKMRYNLLGNGDHWFPGHNAAHLEPVSLAAAVKHSPLADKIPGWLRETHEMLDQAPVKRESES